MGRVTGAWERPIQGVSQQADKDRIDGQCTLQENLIPSPLDGLIKRTGTQHIQKLAETVSEDSLWYSYSRGDEESYIILIEPLSNPRIFDIEGTERTLNLVGGFSSYFQVANPKRDLQLSTIADFSFILNKTVNVQRLDTKAGVNPAMAIVYCQYATYGRDYTISVDGNPVATYLTPDGSVSGHINQVKTNFVAEQLAEQINGEVRKVETLPVTETQTGTNPATYTYHIALTETPVRILTFYNEDKLKTITATQNIGNDYYFDAADASSGDLITATYNYAGATDYNAVVHGNTLFVTALNGMNFNISTIDSSDGNDLVAVQDYVKQLTNLPPYAPEGYVIKVNNQEGYEANSYWLKAETNSDTDKAGSKVRWVETRAQDSYYELDLNTLPHTLISEADGSFTLDLGQWEHRRVGNEDTNPFPSFLGNKISSIGTFQNRILFTSGESAVFSRTNHFFDFFRETTQVASDSDPIDVFADADEINNLVHHSVLDGDIVFFAENGQFLIDGDKPITKASLVFKKVTSYPLNVQAKPAVTGESVMFSFIAGKYAGIREMFTDSFTDTKRARPITEHVAEYIEGTPVDLVASPNINTLLIRTDKSADTIYVYDWLWAGDQKVQAAMHKWKIGGSVLFAKFIGDKIYFVIQRNGAVYLEQMPIGNDPDDSGLDFPVRLDQRAAVQANWTGLRWEWQMPYTASVDNAVFVRGEGCWADDRGTSCIVETDGVNYWTYDDLADTMAVQAVTLTAGTPFESRFIPTRPYLKDFNGRAMGLDRFTLGRIFLNYESIGNTEVYVRDKAARREWRYEHNGRMFGGWNNRVGFAPLDSGQFAVPVRLQSKDAEIEVVTSDYRPFILRDMEWEGMFKQRGRRL